jgi:hypothetical protein
MCDVRESLAEEYDGANADKFRGELDIYTIISQQHDRPLTFSVYSVLVLAASTFSLSTKTQDSLSSSRLLRDIT